MPTPQTVTLPTSLGCAEATRASLNSPWEIGYPWGDDRFYGTEDEVRARMTARIAEYEAEEAKTG